MGVVPIDELLASFRFGKQKRIVRGRIGTCRHDAQCLGVAIANRPDLFRGEIVRVVIEMHLQFGCRSIEHERHEKIKVVRLEIVVFEEAVVLISRKVPVNVELHEIKSGLEK